MFIESVMPSNHLILCRPLLLLPSIFPNIRVFSNESAFRIRWPKYWSFSFNISPFNEHPGLISFRMDWLDLLAWALQKLAAGQIRPWGHNLHISTVCVGSSLPAFHLPRKSRYLRPSHKLLRGLCLQNEQQTMHSP